MLHLRCLLATTDLTEASDAALVHAFRLAQQFDSELYLLHVMPMARRSFHVPAVDSVHCHRSMLDQLKRLGLSLPAGRVKIFVTEADTASQGIVLAASRFDIDLIVTGRQGLEQVHVRRSGCVADVVVREAPCPVLTVPYETSTEPAPGYKRLLVPFDFSDCSQHALMHAKALAVAFGSTVTLLHVQYRNAYWPDEQSPTMLTRRGARRSRVFLEQEMLKLWHTLPGPFHPAEAVVVEGLPVPGVTQYVVTHNTDLVVMATHGMTGLRQFMMGSVSEKVVRDSTRPVFTVKSFARSLVASTPSTFIQPEFLGLPSERMREAPPVPAPAAPSEANRPVRQVLKSTKDKVQDQNADGSQLVSRYQRGPIHRVSS